MTKKLRQNNPGPSPVGPAEELDRLVEDFMEQMMTISSLRQQLDNEMSDGFLNLAQSRKAMGQKSVSSLQFDDRAMTATTLVSLEANDCDIIKLPEVVEVPVTDESSDSEPNWSNSQVEGIRKRIATIGAESTKDNTSKRPVTKRVSRDPLRMFGILVPQSLRSSKASFQRCADVSAKLVECQLKLEQIKKDYAQKLLECEL